MMQTQWGRFARAAAAMAFVSVVSCESDTTSPPHDDNVTLTAAQASTLVTAMVGLSFAHPDLAWLADSTDLVLHAGAKAKPITVTVDGTAKTYYAVGLQRSVVSGQCFRTFHLLAFDDVTSPTAFIVADGYAETDCAATLTSLSGDFGDGSVFAHLLYPSIEGAVDRLARAGTATFTTGASLGDCDAFTPAAGVTCSRTDLQVTLSITSASSDGDDKSLHTASLASVSVPGITLLFQ